MIGLRATYGRAAGDAAVAAILRASVDARVAYLVIVPTGVSLCLSRGGHYIYELFGKAGPPRTNGRHAISHA